MEPETEDKFEAWYAEFISECRKKGYAFPIADASAKILYDKGMTPVEAGIQFIGK